MRSVRLQKCRPADSQMVEAAVGSKAGVVEDQEFDALLHSTVFL